MKLADLRKVAVKKNVRIRFRLPSGQECILNEHGIAEVPGLHAKPDFTLEEVLAQVGEFLVEPVAKSANPSVQRVTRVQLEVMATGPADSGHHEDHED